MRQYLTELLILLVTTAIATTVGVLMLTHPGSVGFHDANVGLDLTAILTSFVVYGALDDLINRVWPEPAAEPETADV